MNNRMRYPFYIPTKGRSEYMVTSRALTAMGVPHYVVVESCDIDNYRKAIDRFNISAEILVLDPTFKEKYETCDTLGLTRSTGPGPARNFAWEHSKSNGYKYHWVMDDNIRRFFRMNKNLKVPCMSREVWTAMEDFCLRYKNVAMAGPNYFFFAPRKTRQPPFVANTRIYSCNFIRNDLPFRWRGRYNEDTILSLDILKGGWCTIQFNAFLQDKMETQKLKGGNTGEFYHKEGTIKEGEKYADTGTIAKSRMIVAVHPDVSRVVRKFGRIHHSVDYSGFKKNKLIKKDDYVKTGTINNYGMTLNRKVK